VIAVAGTLGALAGPALTRSLVDVIGVAPLLVVSAGLLGVAALCVVLLGRWARVHGARRHEAGHEDAVGGGMWDGLKQIFSDPFIRGMAVLLLLADGIGTVNYALMIDYSGATFADAAARTRFHADVDLVSNLLTVTVQIALTRWLLPRSGPGAVIMLWALVSIAVLLLVVFSADPGADRQPRPGLRHGRAGAAQSLHPGAAQRALQGPGRGRYRGLAFRRRRHRHRHERAEDARGDDRRIRRAERDGRVRRGGHRLAAVEARRDGR